MPVSTGIAIYFLIWWITLFAVLPFGITSQHEQGKFAEGTDPGAPVAARVWNKLLWTTLIASGIFAALYIVYRFRLIDFAAVMNWFGPARR